MKHNPFNKKYYGIVILFFFLLALDGCKENNTITSPTTNKSLTSSENADNIPTSSDSSSKEILEEESVAINEAEKAYENFLAGTVDAKDFNHAISDGVVTIKDISLEPDFKTYSALFDMNGDGIPELHLRPGVGNSYVIFTYRDGQIVLWHNGPDYESPLNNGAILYERDGSAPTHINYYYLVLDSDGNEISKVYFSKYHSIDESALTESANFNEFIYEDKEVSEEEWNSLTKEYFSPSTDLIKWSE